MQKLYTEAGRSLSGIPWSSSYPRPQMRRRDWLCLNGDWDFQLNRPSKDGKKTGSYTITVPFCPESLLSGITAECLPGDLLIYRKRFSVPESWNGRRILLHFGAVSRDAHIFLNGTECCRHSNGYLPFSIEITDLLRSGENEIRVEAVNDLSHRFPWGKQSRKRGGMWYTPCSGIWQTVWLEPVPARYIRTLHIRSDLSRAEITADGVTEGVLHLDGKDYPLTDGKVSVSFCEPHLWTPDDPHLYSFTLESGEDCVASYLALRTVTTETVRGIPRLCLNGRPFFFNGLLDQGYWSDGLYTPAVPEAFEQDILTMKSLGFNTLRKHIKIEPEQFYYDCDRLGMIVFQDMVNNGDYHYIRDTVLPTLHFQKRKDLRLNPDPETRQTFLDSMKETVRILDNHPCICLWTIFNEGWGQFRSDDAYRILKELDPTRFIDTTSGWFHQTKSDVDSLHIYFDELHLGTKPLPQFLSEFGGYVWKVPEHSFNTEKTYGYRKYDTREEFLSALRETYGKVLPPLIRKGLCGAVYTQLSDVEDETNGMVTFDRAVVKAKPEELCGLMDQLQKNLD